jgi:cation diffusion facilitator CzcD-associated flavoprotein CzcO
MTLLSSVPTVAIIGAGFGGLGLAVALQRAGIDFAVFEKAGALGGVWRDNDYPGAACDVPSNLYSFSFARRYPWTHPYARQAEILAYLEHCADRFELRRHIRFDHALVAADYDESRGEWRLRFAGGLEQRARVLVSSVGQLHRPSIPPLPGRDSFRGVSFHSARWDHAHELAGEDVAVIGTGASAAQFVPEIVGKVRRLYLFQRSPTWVAPKADAALAPWQRRLLDAVPLLQDVDRLRVFALTELLGYCYRGHRFASTLPTLLARSLLRAQVRDPDLRRTLTPRYPIGCKRIILSNKWLPALCRPNVEVVTAPIEGLTARGVRTRDGRERAVDAVIYGTGFAATEFLAGIQIRGTDGRELAAAWQDGARAHLGLAVPGFPNFFMLYGPNTNLGSGSIVFMLEQQAAHLAALTRTLLERGLRSVEVRADVEQAFVRQMRERSARSTYSGNCTSWYKNADGVNTNNWVGSMVEYRRRVRVPNLADYKMTAATVRP